MAALSHASDLPNGTYSWGAVYSGLAIREIGGRSGMDNISGAGNAARIWRVSGTTNPLTAKAALVDGPVDISSYDDMSIESLEYDVTDEPDAWKFTANYAWVPSVGGYTVNIDTTGGAILVTNALAQTSYAASGQTATDFGTLIDVQDGVPQGVDRILPALKINITARIHSTYISSAIAYAKTLASLTGFMNNDTYLTFASGELLFIGASGDIVGENPSLVFSFLASPNISGATLGGISGISKLGHDYLWFDYRRYQDATTKRTATTPRAAYVGRLYGLGDMTDLKIGVTP